MIKLRYPYFWEAPTVIPVLAGLQGCAEVCPGGLLLPQLGQDSRGADHPGHDVQDNEEEDMDVDDEDTVELAHQDAGEDQDGAISKYTNLHTD